MDSGTVPSTTPAVPAGAGGYDMGARRFGPDIGSFLQQDQFYGALADLGLALDPLTQNRYALAGGNPISYVEWDGHTVTRDNPVSASPTTNTQILNSTWGPAHPFVGCACKGLDNEVKVANAINEMLGKTPTAGLAPSRIPSPASVASRAAMVGGAVLGILAGMLALGGDTEQGANPADGDKSVKTDLKKKAEACLQKSGSEPSDDPVYGPLIKKGRAKQGRATSAERCFGQDVQPWPNPRLNLSKRLDDWTQEKVGAHLLARSLGGWHQGNNGVWAYPRVNDYMRVVEKFSLKSKDRGLRVYYRAEALYRPQQSGPYAVRVYVENSLHQGYDVTIENTPTATVTGGTFGP
jgi:RHS repeat-associated protein